MRRSFTFSHTCSEFSYSFFFFFFFSRFPPTTTTGRDEAQAVMKAAMIAEGFAARDEAEAMQAEIATVEKIAMQIEKVGL